MSTTAERVTAPRRPHLWVLSIGVNQYRDPHLQLQYAAADAQAFADMLKRQDHGPLYDTVHTTVLTDGAATREAILQALDTFLGDATPVDVAVIFLAGHGMRTEKPTAYYFLTASASPTAPYIAGLDMAELNRELLRLHRNIPQMVVLLDTCHAGAVTQGNVTVQVGADLASALVPAEGLYILTAAGAGQRSFELAAQHHGAFTYALLDGLGGAAANVDGLITVSGLASRASQVVQQLTASQQRPYIELIGEDLALAAHPGRFAEVTPPPNAMRVARAEPAPVRERVAIRAFEHLEPNATYDWMRKALSEDVLTAFSGLPQLDVYDEDMLRFVTRDTSDVLDAAQRAGIGMLVEGSYWVQNNQLRVSAQVKGVRPLQLIASARAQGPVDQFSQLTGQLVLDLLDRLQLDVPGPLADQLRHPATTSLASRRLLTEADGGSAPPRATPGTARSAVVPGAYHWHPWEALELERAAHAEISIVGAALAESSQDAGGDLQQTLEGYRRALESKNLDALRNYYEDFTETQSMALTRYFNNAADLHVEFGDLRVAIIGEQAAVSFTRHDRFTDRGTGQPQSVTVRITKRFTKGGRGGWVIQKEQ
jgi:TolB-like protein/ketosteroid isomerase-like protein